MTLLVTERSPLGIVMLADTVAHEGPNFSHRCTGIGKIVYSPSLNVALGGWGKAFIGPRRMDWWLTEFLADSTVAPLSLKELANELVARANLELKALNRSWADLGRRGIHIAGFQGEDAMIYHAHMGDEFEPVRALEVEDSITRQVAHAKIPLADALARGVFQLRNGIYPQFQAVWDRDVALNQGWGEYSSLAARLEHYLPLFRNVAAETQIINSDVSALAFSRDGLKVDQLVVSTKSSGGAFDWTEGIAFRAL